MQHCDALVIGGGPAGATAALLLARAGWSVVLVERHEFPRRKVCGEYLSATNWPLLAELGIAEQFADLAGPSVCEAAIFVGNRQVRAGLPLPKNADPRWGRALSREVLDTLLLDAVAAEGIHIVQPARCSQVVPLAGQFVARIETASHGEPLDVRSPVIIAAHGSWDIGPLATQRQPKPPSGGDWLAFKAHFRETALPPGLMPLLSFADGYGGMVHCDGGRASLSCCIRRRRLTRLHRSSHAPAGDAVLAHMLDSCPALRPVLHHAQREGAWLSAGPIQPGIRRRYQHGVFVIGNAAGEAHPVVAEGISMAMQSAWLLARLLIPRQSQIGHIAVRDCVGREYSAAWRRAFAPRIRAAAAIAHWAEQPRLVRMVLPAIEACPGLLSWGARLSGKARVVATV